MNDRDWLADQFEKNRAHLQELAVRMLGSNAEADDAIQEAWMRVSRAGAGEVTNLGGWLNTIVARICLDVLRSRGARREDDTADALVGDPTSSEPAVDPENDLLIADSVGPALTVVLETLAPAERVAFVLHDMFDITFEEIAPIVSRSPAATRQLASRARRRIRRCREAPDAELARHREIVSAFLAASRTGNFEALLALLDPSVVLHADDLAVQTAVATNWGGRGLQSEVRGAAAVAEALNGRTRGVRLAIIDGVSGAVIAQPERTLGAWLFTIDNERIVEIELVMDPTRLAQLEIDGIT